MPSWVNLKMNPEREELLLALESAAFRLLDAANAAHSVQNQDALNIAHLEKLWDEAEVHFRAATEACRDSVVSSGRGNTRFPRDVKTYCRNCGIENIP